MPNTIKHLGLIAFFFISSFSNAQEVDQEFSWPQEIKTKQNQTITLYQPQFESFESDILEARMAVTIQVPDDEMIFGALWFKARMLTDMEDRTVVLEKMNIFKTHFPDMTDNEKIEHFSTMLSAEMESWNLEMSLDRILAGLDEVENLKQLSDKIDNTPPVIYFRTTPAVLLMIDGDPILKKDEESGLEFVVNTPFFIVKELKSENYYVNGGPFWYTSKEILKGWEETENIPSAIKKFAEKSIDKEESDSVAQSFTVAPELIVETKAAELIMVDGTIDYQAIEQTSLLYVSNSENDIIMDISSQNHYILIAGRWYFSKSLKDGDWKFAEPSELPKDFLKIPEESELASVRSSIPGTSEAQTALLEQSIPQTATIDRKEAKVEVKYDGDPQFEKIEGTDVSHAINTDKTVLLIKKKYYCVDDAVWFVSKKAVGPWEVSTERPDEVDQIPPESPVYNVKYVYIYDSTPEVVYIGYTPGYTYSYVYGGVVVYGSGYYYQPWYGRYYYPRPVTWGYGVHYSPYGGWGFSYGISFGWIGWVFHPYRRGYWGGRHYRRGYRHGYRSGRRSGYRAGYRAGRRNSSRNMYSSRNSGVRKSANSPNSTGRASASAKSNNMYADKNGNVYQQNNQGGYDNKSNNRQKAQQNNGQSSQQRQQLNQSSQNRKQGTQNYNRSNQYRSGGSAGRDGGGRRR